VLILIDNSSPIGRSYKEEDLIDYRDIISVVFINLNINKKSPVGLLIL